MKKKNYVGKAVMLGALLAPIGLPTVSVLADGFYQNQTSAHAADITNWIASTTQQITNNLITQNIIAQQLDCQKYLNGNPKPWVYGTGLKKVSSGRHLWTTYAPNENGYYWTYYRLYNESGQLIDDHCYGAFLTK